MPARQAEVFGGLNDAVPLAGDDVDGALVEVLVLSRGAVDGLLDESAVSDGVELEARPRVGRR